MNEIKDLLNSFEKDDDGWLYYGSVDPKDAAVQLAAYERLAESWQQYFQAQEIKDRNQGRKSWTWIPFITSAEDKARAALVKLGLMVEVTK